ncbi:hypothetical protein DXG03_004002 [Asterophora parasitica]|uniref:Uncharacterized protein n=1 Tax=Asterophora parasitica TaxID=117018 RepID=A0A9P7K6D9_9AGAR|nr:hypothetical protein DXG03_004002 [Asterophora parasitica]
MEDFTLLHMKSVDILYYNLNPKAMTQEFKRGIEDIAKRVCCMLLPSLPPLTPIEQAECLGVETNSWIFIAGQHSKSTSTSNFVCYSSPKLCEDAKEDVDKMMTVFGNVTQDLLLI